MTHLSNDDLRSGAMGMYWLLIREAHGRRPEEGAAQRSDLLLLDLKLEAWDLILPTRDDPET
jgi:hypothetical protein